MLKRTHLNIVIPRLPIYIESIQPFHIQDIRKNENSNILFDQVRQYNPIAGRFISQDVYWNTKNMIYWDNSKRMLPDSFAIGQINNLYVYAIE